jgi:hypothetical protein
MSEGHHLSIEEHCTNSTLLEIYHYQGVKSVLEWWNKKTLEMEVTID